MFYFALKTLHLLSVIVWVGGMVFAHFFLRPAAQTLEPPQRVPLMFEVLKRFLTAAGIAVVTVVVSGLGIIGMVMMGSDGAFKMPLDWNIMATLGLVMAGIFVYIYLGLFPRLEQAVAAFDWAAGGTALAGIRRWVGINLALGIVVVVTTLML